MADAPAAAPPDTSTLCPTGTCACVGGGRPSPAGSVGASDTESSTVMPAVVPDGARLATCRMSCNV